MQYHIAEFNMAKLAHSYFHPKSIEIASALSQVYVIAQRAPGFVWRQTSEAPVYEDYLIVHTLSVWQTLEHLHQFLYSGIHKEYYVKRREWFVQPTGPSYVLWWIPVGTLPTIPQAKWRHEHLVKHGATPLAFDFKTQFSVESLPQE